MEAFFITLVTLFNHINGEVLFIGIFLSIAFGFLWSWNRNPDIDFDASNLFKTNGHEDISKIVYSFFSACLMWSLIIQVKNKNLDFYMLAIYCGFAFGPTLFNSTLRTISSVMGKSLNHNDDKRDECVKPEVKS